MEAETKQTAPAAQPFDVYKWAAWAHANRKPLINAVVAVAAIAIGISLYSWKKDQDELAANNKFFSLPPVIAAGEKAPRASAKDLEAIANAYPGTSMGQQAELLAGQALFNQGNYKEAMTEFSKFIGNHGSSPFIAQASVGFAACQEAQGQTKEAIQSYKDIIAKYSDSGVTSPIKLTLARLCEEQNQLSDALNYYNQLTSSPTPNPYDPWAAEARERKQALLVKHPELNKEATPAVSSPVPLKVAPAPAAAPASGAPAKAK